MKDRGTKNILFLLGDKLDHPYINIVVFLYENISLLLHRTLFFVFD